MPLIAANEELGEPEQLTGTMLVPLMFQFKGNDAAPPDAPKEISPTLPVALGEKQSQ